MGTWHWISEPDSKLRARHPGMDYVASGLPWFLVPSRHSAGWEEYVARFGPTGVHDHRVVGGLCLPSACDLRTAALHLVPLVAPWWLLEPQPLAPVNETHVWMPAPLAVDHELFPSHGIMPMWVSKRSCQGSQQAFCSHSWQFALQEYHPYLRADPVVVAWVAAQISAAMWFYSTRMPLSSVLAAVGKPRGSLRADVLRISLTATVIWMHTFSHGSWLPVERPSDAYWLGHSTDVAMKVNAAFLLLSVHLRDRPRSQGDLPTPRPMGSKLAEAIRHAWRRWLRVGPLLCAWTAVYLLGFVRCIPMNNTIKSSALHTWFSERREECSVPIHWAMTCLMLHEPLTGRPSPCHNADIFETLFLLDVVTFTIAQASDGLCWLLLPASLLWRSQLILGAGEERWVLAYRHRFAMLLPVALLASALRIFLGVADGVDTGPVRAGFLRFLGALLVAGSCVQDALSYGTAHWQREPFLGLSRRLQSLKTFQGTAAFHVSELLFVIGFQLLLRESAARERPAAGCRWSWISALARLSLGMNLSNLFVFHFIAGFYLQEPQALTPTSALLSFAAVYAISATLALLAMVAVEIPAMTLLAQISKSWVYGSASLH
ncbi:unnamed protein product [Symbiodinium sp. CCMP2592]|nr:unnamed protein product [Symbiodinium sp. CCMP2592]